MQSGTRTDARPRTWALYAIPVMTVNEHDKSASIRRTGNTMKMMTTSPINTTEMLQPTMEM